MKTICALLIPFAMGMACTSQNKTDFSGTWKLNLTQSQMGDRRGPGDPGGPDSTMRPPRFEGDPGRPRGWMGGGPMTITQNSDQLIIERTMPRRGGEDRTVRETYTLDGKECVNDSRLGEKTSVCKWSEDGQTLTVESLQVFNRDGQSREMRTVDVYSLQGNQLIVETTRDTPRGEHKTRLVYDRN
ncbi:hypothetical protein GX408_00165 [bacterium]|nr:hypothetical protein [bacterium]